MGKQEHFEKNWDEFTKDNNIDEMWTKDIARCFYEFGFSKGALDG